MGGINYRQKNSDGPLYNPERDYAYITPTLMLQAVENLDEKARDAETADWYAKNEITQDELVAITAALAAAQRDFVNAADPVRSFDAALQRHRFFDFRYPVREVLFSAVGRVCCAAWFTAVREVSQVGEESPAQAGMARFSSTACEFARRNGAPMYDADHLAEHLRMKNDVLQARLNAVYSELRATQEQLAGLAAKQKEQERQASARDFRTWFRSRK